MSSIEFDLRYVNTGLGAFSHYLKSDELYYPIGLTMPIQGAPYPQLSAGNLLFYLNRLKGFKESNIVNARQIDAINQAEEEFDILFNEWAANWNKKAAQEIKSRILQWTNYLTDLTTNAEDNTPHYSSEVRTRAVIELLMLYCLDLPGAVRSLPVLDEQLRGKFKEGEFIWDHEISSAFPEEVYWYLWGTIS